MAKRKVLFVIHQLNIGGVQKSVIPMLDAIDYETNEVTLYIRKNRTDLLPFINKSITDIRINKDKTRYYRKPYSVLLLLKIFFLRLLRKDNTKAQAKLDDYIKERKMRYEKKHYFSDNSTFDVAISVIQEVTAQFVADFIVAKRKIMLYRDSTDCSHELHERIMSEFDSIYAVSCGAKDALSSFYPQFASKMKVIETFVSSQKVMQLSTEYPVEESRLMLATCGRMTSVKGYDIAVDAARIIKDEGIDFVWYFVGDGVERQKVEKKISDAHLEANIIITGLIKNPYPYIKNCDLYVQPSYEESFGRTIKEAMILQRVVVSTATIGAKEQITDGENGFLTEISSKGIAERILFLLKDEHAKKKVEYHMSLVDYSQDFNDYKKKWKKLLEG
jgi:glycosyltransferase involved in cell wall biosynthesis